ncbi:PREDICTED: uncharacterized protein LOC108556576 [Nicrophorus vespilloides]|uniref:Uncharacterized protein LOC108556576 n=1 Tax=Nicrophorus vespilloides TaxID=110193 RepID=A0ABM1M0Y7_NICVS|nr:PREDICTED: uncharacterized protein LOC108556576 [Nicrophorus vespilloides]
MNRSLLLFVLISSLLVKSVTPWAIYMWPEIEYKGKAIGVAGEEEECVPLPSFFTAASINPRDFCVNLYETADCSGVKYAFFQSSLNLNNLNRIIRKRVGSVKSCNTDY